MNRIGWDKYFMLLAKIVALRSGCNSRLTGAIIVKNRRIISTGYNGTIQNEFQCTNKGNNFCLHRSIKHNDKGNNKYSECPAIHAEQNAMNQIAKYGGKELQGSSIYCTLFPCIFCFKNIQSVGIKEIFYELDYHSNDKKRDLYWTNKVKNSNIKIKQIKLDKNDIENILPYIIECTSKRRIK